MPEIGGALDSALSRISLDIKTNINAMVRASIEETLHTQIKNLRVAVDAKAAMREATASGTMPGFSGSPPPTSSDMALAKSFEPRGDRGPLVSGIWEKSGHFQAGFDESNPNRFCILLPPPNVTGTLHMGHAFQHTLMDALIRYHRMRGFNTNCGNPAPITRESPPRSWSSASSSPRATRARRWGATHFVERVWKWKEESGSTITRQMRRLGASWYDMGARASSPWMKGFPAW